MAVTAPRSKDDLTAEWLTEILQEQAVLGPETMVEEVVVEDIGVGRGFLCQTVRVTPSYAGPADDAPASLVAKVPTFIGFPGWVFDALETWISSEHAWYRELSASVPVRTPRHFGSVFESKTAHALLIEDVSHLRQLDQGDACDAEPARLIVRALARAHAHWWESAELRESAWLPSVEDHIELWGTIMTNAADQYLREMVQRINPEFAPVGERLVRDFGQLMRRSAESASTLVHGDYRLENFMFGPAGSDDEVLVLDWQLIGFGSGLRDLAYFTSQSLEPGTRREIEWDLVDRYHAGLEEDGVTGYSLHQCREDYRLGLLTSMMLPFAAHLGLSEIEEPGPDADEEEWDNYRQVMEAGEALIINMSERNIAAILETRADELLGA